MGEQTVKIKEIDFKIVSLLIKNPQISNRDLAKKLKSTPLTIGSRINYLKKNNALKPMWQPNYKLFGYKFIIMSTIALKPEFHSVQNMEMIKSHAKSAYKGVLFCHKTMSYRIVTLLVVKDIAQFHHIVDTISDKYAHMIADRSIRIFPYTDDFIFQINSLLD